MFVLIPSRVLPRDLLFLLALSSAIADLSDDEPSDVDGGSHGRGIFEENRFTTTSGILHWESLEMNSNSTQIVQNTMLRYGNYCGPGPKLVSPLLGLVMLPPYCLLQKHPSAP